VRAALLGGLLLDAALGDQRRLHPVAGFGAVAQRVEHAVWAPSRLRGALYAGGLVVGTGVAVAVADRSLRGRPALRGAFGAAVLWSTLGGRSLGSAARALGSAVAAGDLERARALAPALVGRDPSRLDADELCRAAVESVAENTTDAVVAPLGWFALLGPGGAAAYRAANTLDAMVGHRSPRYEAFGWAAARLDDALTWPWARAATALTVALAPRARLTLGPARLHPSPNGGLIEAAFAGALGVRLGGVNDYAGRIEHRPAFGDGPPPTPRDVERAVRLSRRLGLLAGALAAAR
jgi:adenosylcobinamide-phosphate synthase